MNVVLLRVGIDTGCGGMAGPLLSKGKFEFIPIDGNRPHIRGLTYGNISGRHGRKLIDYFPAKRQEKMRDCFVHDDPEFQTYTYGDPTRPKQGLRELKTGDLLVFYAGLCGYGDCVEPTALYIVGYFEVMHAGTFLDLANKLSKTEFTEAFSRNWHVLHGDIGGKTYKRTAKDGSIKRSKSQLLLVKGGKGSRLLHKAVRLSAPDKKIDRGGHRIFVLDPALKQHFGSFTKLNAIQRSVPRWVGAKFVGSAATFVRTLK